MAEQLTKSYARSLGIDLAIFTINFEHVYEHYIYPEYGIRLVEDLELGCDENGKQILGCFDPCSDTAYLDMSLHPANRDPRRVFTCWHEVGGHGVLQGEWLRREMGRLRDASQIVTTEESITPGTANVLERQANLSAAHAAAPTWLVKHAVRETLELTRPIRYVGPREYCLSVRGRTLFYDVADFNDLCRVVARHITWRFGGLSIESLSYRVGETGYVLDESKPKLRLHRAVQAAEPVGAGAAVALL